METVAERSAGLPIYVRLVLEDLVRRQVRPDSASELPKSLEAYYEELLGRYGIDDLHQVLTPLVATLAVAAEPLDEPALFALLAHRRIVEPDAEGLDLVRRAVQAAGAVLRLAPTPQGTFGHALYHDTFRRYVQENSTTQQATATAGRALSDAAGDWAEAALEGARDYLLRRGIAHLLLNMDRDTALALLKNPEYLIARCDLSDGAFGLIVDLDRLLPTEQSLAPWHTFFLERAHLLRGDTVVSLALEAGRDHPVGAAVYAWSSTRPTPGCPMLVRASNGDHHLVVSDASFGLDWVCDNVVAVPRDHGDDVFHRVGAQAPDLAGQTC